MTCSFSSAKGLKRIIPKTARVRRKLGEAAEERAEAFSTAVASEKLLAVYAALVRDKGLG